MTIRPGSGRLLAVLAATAALLNTASTSMHDVNCTDETECSGGAWRMRAEGQPRGLVLVWRGPGARASLALLLPKLSANGLCGVRLCEAPQGLCALISSDDPPQILNNAFVVGIETDSRIPCPYASRLISSSGATRAPLPPRLHAVLSRNAMARGGACLGASDTRFYADAKLLSDCGFATPIVVRVPREWSEIDGDAVSNLLKKLAPAHLYRDVSSRANLQAAVDAAATSFLFVDAELWRDEPRALLLDAEADSDPPLLAVERGHLIKHAPWLLDTLREHRPAPRQLRHLLELEERLPTSTARGDAAARTALSQRAGALGTAVRPERYRVVVAECAEDGDASDVNTALAQLAEDISAEAGRRDWRFKLQLEAAVVRCEEPPSPTGEGLDSLADAVQNLARSLGAHRLIGVVGSGSGYESAAASARNAGVELVAYDARVETAAELARALRATLGACGWRRVALVSEEGAVARAVEARLTDVGAVRAAALGRSAADARAALSALHASGASVFVVNAGGTGAARALAAAAALGLGKAAWVAREWAGPRPPPLRLLALSAVPRRAGNATGRRLLAGAPASAALTRYLGEAPWPTRAASIADAVLTLGLGFARLMSEHPELRYDHRSNETHELLHRSLAEGEPLPGVASDLTFDSSGVPTPAPLRLELWQPDIARPELFDIAASDACPAPPVSDGTSRCAMPTGDPFEPVCLDALAAVGSPLLLLAALLAWYGAAAASRRGRARRRAYELRLRAEAGAALLARQPDTVPALAKHLVDRQRVRLLHELGAGRYGRVWLAELSPAPEDGARGAARRVAAKAPHAGAAPAEEGELLREAAALAPLRHPHVLLLAGVCVSAGGVLLLTPVARHGDLLRYLRARRPPGGEAGEARHVAALALTRLAREAALALAYLASRGVVHCDVRAANCLVDERRSLLLADFGMARPLRAGFAAGTGVGASDGEYACRRRALFPVLWMAPESLTRGVFSSASDVWALGVLALELVSLGARPFGAMGAADAVALVRRGGHARLPVGCSAATRELARACWRGAARARPTAREVADWLEARPDALEPAPPRDAQDADSGFGEPAASLTDWEPAAALPDWEPETAVGPGASDPPSVSDLAVP